MDISELRQVLRQAASLFGASGARAQAKAVDDVGKLVDDSGDRTIDQFVENTLAALNAPSFASLAPEEVVKLLIKIGTDSAKFVSLMKKMKAKDFDKETALEVAARYTGGRKSSWASKAKALRAIGEKFDESVYLASKGAANARVTPW